MITIIYVDLIEVKSMTFTPIDLLSRIRSIHMVEAKDDVEKLLDVWTSQ